LIPAVVREITKGPVGIVYDAISSQETQRASLDVLAPNGSLIVTHPPSADAQKDNRYITFVFASIRDSKNTEFGRVMYAKLTRLLADGSIKVILSPYIIGRGSDAFWKPNKVELIAGGLKGIPAALEGMVAGKVSGVKVVAHPRETPTA
jgi:threonine dehydrogenase-like Zn-dependent dehydrogenase